MLDQAARLNASRAASLARSKAVRVLDTIFFGVVYHFLLLKWPAKLQAGLQREMVAGVAVGLGSLVKYGWAPNGRWLS